MVNARQIVSQTSNQVDDAMKTFIADTITAALASTMENLEEEISRVSSNQGNDENSHLLSNNVKDSTLGLHVIDNIGNLAINDSNCEGIRACIVTRKNDYELADKSPKWGDKIDIEHVVLELLELGMEKKRPMSSLVNKEGPANRIEMLFDGGTSAEKDFHKLEMETNCSVVAEILYVQSLLGMGKSEFEISNGVAVNSYVLVVTSSGTDFRVFEKFLGSENVWSYIVVIEFDWNGDSWPMKNGVNCVVVESVQGESQLNHSDSSLSMVEEEGPEADTKRVHELFHTEDKSPLSFVSCYNDGLLTVNLQSILGLKDAEKEIRVFEKRASELVSCLIWRCSGYHNEIDLCNLNIVMKGCLRKKGCLCRLISEILLDNLFLEDLIGNEISNVDELHQWWTLDTNVITFCSKRMLIGSYHTSIDKSVTSGLTSTVKWGLIDLINLQLARVVPGKLLQLLFVIRLEIEGTYFRI
ncbi:hypothetical protein Tco_0766389 [Tanacetum coccineum]